MASTGMAILSGLLGGLGQIGRVQTEARQRQLEEERGRREERRLEALIQHQEGRAGREERQLEELIRHQQERLALEREKGQTEIPWEDLPGSLRTTYQPSPLGTVSVKSSLLDYIKQKVAKQDSLTQGAQLADLLEAQHRTWTAAGNPPDTYAMNTAQMLRTVGATEKTLPAYEQAFKAIQERANEQDRYARQLNLLQRLGLDLGQAAAPSGRAPFPAAPGNLPVTPSPAITPTAPPALAPSPKQEPERARQSTLLVLPRVTAKGEVEIGTQAPTDPHDLKALAEFDQLYRALGLAERKRVDQLVKQDKADIARLQGAAAVENRAEAPLALVMKENEHYVDRQSGEEVDYLNRSIKDLQKHPGRYTKLDAKAFDQFRGTNEVLLLLNEFNKVAQQLTTQPGANLAQAAALWGQTQLGIPNAGVALQALDGIVLRLARAMQGSSSQLSDRDTAAVRGILPKTTDTMQTAQQRIGLARNIVLAMREVVLGAPRTTLRRHLNAIGGEEGDFTGGTNAPSPTSSGSVWKRVLP